MNRYAIVFCALCIAAAGPALSATGAQHSAERSVQPSFPGNEQHLVREVRHQLVMLPYYSVFDNLEFAVNGRTVTLMGQVTKPTLKSDAENAVKGIEGVENVVNRIQVLPLSPMDDRIRLAEFRAIYGQPGLDRYAMQAVPPIHIIVNAGNVTLDGVVATQGDKDLAGIRAKGVSGVFSVTNNLKTESKSK